MADGTRAARDRAARDRDALGSRTSGVASRCSLAAGRRAGNAGRIEPGRKRDRTEYDGSERYERNDGCPPPRRGFGRKRPERRERRNPAGRGEDGRGHLRGRQEQPLRGRRRDEGGAREDRLLAHPQGRGRLLVRGLRRRREHGRAGTRPPDPTSARCRTRYGRWCARGATSNRATSSSTTTRTSGDRTCRT